jgi:hypothetical protein
MTTRGAHRRVGGAQVDADHLLRADNHRGCPGLGAATPGRHRHAAALEARVPDGTEGGRHGGKARLRTRETGASVPCDDVGTPAGLQRDVLMLLSRLQPARSVQSRTRAGASYTARASAAPEVHPRRAALAALPLAALLLASACASPPAAVARDLAAAEAAKEARKAALRKAAEESATTGVGEAAFAESDYSIGDDHRCVPRPRGDRWRHARGTCCDSDARSSAFPLFGPETD